MQLNALTTALVSLVVAVIVIALVAVPVIEDTARGTPYAGQNTGADAKYDYMESPSFTFTWTGTAGSSTVQIGDVTETLTISNDDIPVVMSDKVTIRVRSNGLTWYDLVDDAYAAINSSSASVVLTVADGAYTLTQGGTEKATGTMDNGCFVMSSKGEMGVFSGDPKITSGGDYYVASFFNVASYGPFRVYEATGDTLGAAYVEAFGVSSGSIVGGYTVTATINYQETGGNQMVGVVGGVNWTWTDGDDSGTTDHRYVIAPITFESTPTGTGDDTNSILLSIIPILLILTAVMIAVRLLRDA